MSWVRFSFLCVGGVLQYCLTCSMTARLSLSLVVGLNVHCASSRCFASSANLSFRLGSRALLNLNGFGCVIPLPPFPLDFGLALNAFAASVQVFCRWMKISVDSPFSSLPMSTCFH